MGFLKKMDRSFHHYGNAMFYPPSQNFSITRKKYYAFISLA